MSFIEQDFFFGATVASAQVQVRAHCLVSAERVEVQNLYLVTNEGEINVTEILSSLKRELENDFNVKAA